MVDAEHRRQIVGLGIVHQHEHRRAGASFQHRPPLLVQHQVCDPRPGGTGARWRASPRPRRASRRFRFRAERAAEDAVDGALGLLVAVNDEDGALAVGGHQNRYPTRANIPRPGPGTSSTSTGPGRRGCTRTARTCSRPIRLRAPSETSKPFMSVKYRRVQPRYAGTSVVRDLGAAPRDELRARRDVVLVSSAAANDDAQLADQLRRVLTAARSCPCRVEQRVARKLRSLYQDHSCGR